MAGFDMSDLKPTSQALISEELQGLSKYSNGRSTPTSQALRSEGD
jgi:hypothetical protein